jgi:deoxyribonuclease-1
MNRYCHREVRSAVAISRAQDCFDIARNDSPHRSAGVSPALTMVTRVSGMIRGTMKFGSVLIAFFLLAVAFSLLAEQRRIPDYDAARSLFWRSLYNQGGETLYCGEKFGDDRRGLNIEHVFPMSWVTRELRCGKRNQCRRRSERFNRIEADLHNLFPSRREINDARSSYRFAEIPGEVRRFGSCDFEIDERQRTIEPRPASRGEIARAMFYMRDTYDLPIFRRQTELLLRWHRNDPPSDEERRRNDLIEKIQGTRNIYIDVPETAAHRER